MNDTAQVRRPTNWRRRFWCLLAAAVSLNLALSFTPVRGWLIYPLYVNDADARADAVYVMADGIAYWERLHMASDLYHMHRVSTIFVLEESRAGPYNFVRGQKDTMVQRATDYLTERGVPEQVIRHIPPVRGDWMSSRSEARAVADAHPNLTELVVVTSAPHTRRAKLCFQRSYGGDATILVVSATAPSESVETHFPIWIEYAKLVVYWCLA